MAIAPRQPRSFSRCGSFVTPHVSSTLLAAAFCARRAALASSLSSAGTAASMRSRMASRSEKCIRNAASYSIMPADRSHAATSGSSMPPSSKNTCACSSVHRLILARSISTSSAIASSRSSSRSSSVSFLRRGGIAFAAELPNSCCRRLSGANPWCPSRAVTSRSN
eukprot:6220366-Prymnesium_polylepis.1